MHSSNAHAGSDCAADLNGSGIVNAADLAMLLGAWGPNPDHPADLDQDGTVGAADLALLLGDWGQICQTEFVQTDLAGYSLSQYPFFEFVTAFNETQTFEVSIDPSRFPTIADQSCDIYVVESKSVSQWLSNPTLVDVRGGPQTHFFNGATIQDNAVTITDSDELSGDAGIGFGVPYDIVCDCNQDGILNGPDFIDGFGDKTESADDEAGLYVVRDPTVPGPLEVTALDSYSVGPVFGIVPTRVLEVAFYPTNIESMGELPLVTISHCCGAQHTWYNHIGLHLASYGYVVMSHQTNTGPGVGTAAVTTLGHTDAFLDQLDTIGGGVMNGHVDSSRILWTGHSRGGEGVIVARDRILKGLYVPTHFSADSIVLLETIAPTNFLGVKSTHPHDVPFHVWVAGADADLSGCAGSSISQPYQILDRGEVERMSTGIYGAGHGDFYGPGVGAGSSATGPCLIGRPATNTILKGILLPLAHRFTQNNVPAVDVLSRQWESFHPIGAPFSAMCPETGEDAIVVNLTYRDHPNAAQFVIDDYQIEFATSVSSSGGSVTSTVASMTEDRLDDVNTNFTWLARDPMNGMTYAGNNDDARGAVFQWSSDRSYELEIIEAERDLTDDTYLSFRACQGSRHPNTIAVIEDLTFTVSLRDTVGTLSSINIGAYGGGIEEPYLREGCGDGVGWNNEFETIRIRLTDFLHNDSGLNLSDIEAVRFDFGPSFGSYEGRLGLDDIVISKQ